MERVAGVLELLDRPVPPADRVASLADIDRLNEWFGGYALTLREIRRVAATVDEGDAFVAVDVGGGPAAFATRLVDWARSARRAIARSSGPSSAKVPRCGKRPISTMSSTVKSNGACVS